MDLKSDWVRVQSKTNAVPFYVDADGTVMAVRCGKCGEFKPTDDFRKNTNKRMPHGVKPSYGCAACRKQTSKPRGKYERYPGDAVIVERLRAVYISEGVAGLAAGIFTQKHGALGTAIRTHYKKDEIEPGKRFSSARYAQCVLDATGLNYETDVRKRKRGGAYVGWTESEIVDTIRGEIEAGRGMSVRDVMKRFPALFGAICAYGTQQSDHETIGAYGAGLNAIIRHHIDPEYSYDDTLSEGTERMGERAAAGFRFEDIFHDVLNAAGIAHERGERRNGVDFRLSDAHIIDTKLSRGTLAMAWRRNGENCSLKYLDEYPEATLEIVYAIDDGDQTEFGDRVRFTHVSEYIDRITDWATRISFYDRIAELTDFSDAE